MSNPPTTPDPIEAGDRLRALKSDHIAQRYGGQDDGLQGLRELSSAFSEDRTTAYLFQKSWADPLNRTFFILAVSVISVGLIILLSQ